MEPNQQIEAFKQQMLEAATVLPWNGQNRYNAYNEAFHRTAGFVSSYAETRDQIDPLALLEFMAITLTNACNAWAK